MNDTKIYQMLKDETLIPIIAKEVIEAFQTKANNDTISYSFDIEKGTGKIKKIEPNTFFDFDPDKGSTLEEFKNAMYNEELKDITDNQEKLLEEDLKSYLKDVSAYIDNNYSKELRDALRKAILPKSTEEDIPLTMIVILTFEISDFSSIPESFKYLMKIGKYPDAHINTDEVVLYIQEKQEETGKSVEQIFEEEYLKNPLFDGISGIQSGDKYLYDIGIKLFVDYSLAQLPPKEIFENKENDGQVK